MTNVIVLQEHTPGTPLYTPSQWYTSGKFWYTLGCTIHPVDKHWSTASKMAANNGEVPHLWAIITSHTVCRFKMMCCAVYNARHCTATTLNLRFIWLLLVCWALHYFNI